MVNKNSFVKMTVQFSTKGTEIQIMSSFIHPQVVLNVILLINTKKDIWKTAGKCLSVEPKRYFKECRKGNSSGTLSLPL